MPAPPVVEAEQAADAALDESKSMEDYVGEEYDEEKEEEWEAEEDEDDGEYNRKLGANGYVPFYRDTGDDWA